MAATVYYIDLTREQSNQLNNNPKGWGGEIGSAYLRAQDGKFDSTNTNFIHAAARFEDDLFSSADDLEEIWTRLQNGFKPWTEDEYAQCLTEFPRSMSVGDLVVFDNGDSYRCASIGFEPFNIKGLGI
ncbi:MAG: hypothetical protein HC836_10555 [Richelia sp. RM2_1_2]|nr:hypothetical protein [Richelia sp. RM2_1_2]